jgi:5-(carboxyamino)imidazole ribonucleotide mutase
MESLMAIRKKTVVGIIMGSRSDWPTMEEAAKVLDDFGIGYEAEVVSAHRTPDKMMKYAETARCARVAPHHRRRWRRGAFARDGRGQDDAARARASRSRASALDGLDSLLSIAQMPAGSSRRYFRHRPGRREERRALRRVDPRARRSAHWRACSQTFRSTQTRIRAERTRTRAV